MSEALKRDNRRRLLQGVVLSDKMQKTRVVQVIRVTKHSKYNKIVRMAAKYKAHDEKNESKMNDVVRIMETRPLSKDKRWLITEVLSKAS